MRFTSTQRTQAHLAEKQHQTQGPTPRQSTAEIGRQAGAGVPAPVTFGLCGPLVDTRAGLPAQHQAQGGQRPHRHKERPDRQKHGIQRRRIAAYRGEIVSKETADQGAQHPIIPGDKRQLQRRPDESEKAHAARIAYCRLDRRAKRSIAAAYRSVKGKAPDADTKTPGYFGAWAAKHSMARNTQPHGTPTTKA